MMQTNARRTIDERMPRSDGAALSWHFSTGSAAFERSTMGPMLDHASLFAFGKVGPFRCRKCDYGVIPDGRWCLRCQGTGFILTVIERRQRTDDEMPVNETMSGSGGYTPDDEVMARFAVVSRRLGLLPVRLRQALESYHGPHGDRCSDAQAWRLVALYPLTPAGQRLVKLALEVGDDETRERYRTEPTYERAFRQVAAQKTNPKPQRGALIEAAEEQSTELYTEACDRWLDLKPKPAAPPSRAEEWQAFGRFLEEVL
jgi:hypothetical protein